jgi:hypothetical protein
VGYRQVISRRPSAADSRRRELTESIGCELPLPVVMRDSTQPNAIAFSRKGDPDLGDFEPAEILARFGETPDELE